MSDITMAGPVTEPGMDRRLWFALPIATLAIYMVWGGLMNMIIARRIAELIADPQASAAVLGTVMAIGASIALVAQPVLGSFSDRTSDGAIGRRNKWILGGSVAAGVLLLVAAFHQNLIQLSILFAFIVLTLSGAHAALSTVLPERVPPEFQGKMSGICGSMVLLGVLLGVSLAGFAPTARQGFLGLAMAILVVGPAYAIFMREPATVVHRAQHSGSALLAIFRDFPTFRTHRNFWLTFISRFTMLVGNCAVHAFNLYIVRDYLGISGSVSELSRLATTVVAVNTACCFVFSIVGGFLCDRTQRIRIFVVVSALALLPVSILFCWPSLTVYFVAHALLGTVFGIYMSVDLVLIARVLPKTGNVARDMGILNVANSGPQALAPVIAGALIATTASYMSIFVFMGFTAILAAFAAMMIRGIR